MQGPDTAPWGHAPVKTSHDYIDLTQGPSIWEQALTRPSDDGDEPEPDWNALRAQAAQVEVLERASAAFKVRLPAPLPHEVELSPAALANQLCMQAQAELDEAERQYERAETDEEAELAAQRYELAHAKLTEAEAARAAQQAPAVAALPKAPEPAVAAYQAPPIRAWQPPAVVQAPAVAQAHVQPAPVHAQPVQRASQAGHADLHAAVFLSPSIAPASQNFPAAPAFDAAPQWDATDLDEAPVRRSSWLPKLLAAVAVIALGVGGVAYSQYTTAEAERQARTEKLLEEMRQADAQRALEEKAREEAAKQAAIAADQARAALKAQATATEEAAGAANALGLQKSEPEPKATKVGKAKKGRPAAKRRMAAHPAKRRGHRPASGPRSPKSVVGSSTASASDPLFGL